MFRFSIFFRFHGFRYSTLSSSIDSNRKPHLLLVDYLMDSLQFSKQDAISISTKSKVTRLKSTINSDLVVNIFKTYGLDLSQIRQIVSSVPKILTCKPNKTLEPKIRVFHELGLSGSDLVSFIQNSPNIMWSGLDTKIMPCLQLLRQVLGSDEIVIQVMNNRTRRLFFTNNFMERLSTNVLLLQKFGLLNERIVMFVLNNPNKLIVDPTLLESKLSYVEEKLGISRESPIFIHALTAVLWYTDSEIERKMQNFRSFGWSDSDIALLFRGQPYCLTMSEANMRNKLNFYMKDLGYTPSYLMTCHAFFTLSLDKRVIPRNAMLKILREKKLVSSDKPSLITIATYNESKFLEFLRGFEDDVPCLRKTYLDSVKSKAPNSIGACSDSPSSSDFMAFAISTLSSTIDPNRKPHLLLVDYLMDSLQFSKKDAISISTKAKLTHLKSTINSDLVLNIFKTYGLNLSQIRQIVSSVPKILTCKPNKTLEPKIRFFHELGLSGSDLVSFIKNNPRILWTGLHTKIIPCFGLLREVLGSDEIVIQVMNNRTRRLFFTNNFMERLWTNVLLLQNFGLSNERITMFILDNPNKITVDPNRLESRLSYVQEKLGISRDSPTFIHALTAVLWYTDSEIERKIQNFRSFGWSDSDIALLFMIRPYCLKMSEANIVEFLHEGSWLYDFVLDKLHVFLHV
ncbi:hypothetical protein OSB04_025974 [Centaurea solstitialis]|uniref:Uncharacterized protein n=1 Tax=Centaurea solstitialis TaxID=347529 RepID=A0AA38T7J0_9ASTR|nr:hypothetical protein OSB04_025974 [Centaurea solstitialis]